MAKTLASARFAAVPYQEASDALLSAFEVGDIGLEALLFQTAYLTIAAVQRIGVMPRYRLCCPSLEVRASLNEALLRRLSTEAGPVMARSGRLYELLLANDFAGMENYSRRFSPASRTTGLATTRSRSTRVIARV